MTTAEKTALHPELAGYRAEFEEATTLFSDLTDGLSDEQFNWRPSDKEWSAAECVDHLVAIGTLLKRRIEESIELGREKHLESDGPFKHPRLGNRILRTVGPRDEHNRRKFKAPEIYAPTSNHSVSRLETAFGELQDQLIEYTERANGLDLGRIRRPSPIPLVKLSLGQWFGLAANHQKRHFQQANEVKQKLLAL